MKIQVIGSGCSTCKNLFELTKKAVNELNISADVEYSTDISKIIEMGVMQSPVLAVDGIPIMVGAGNYENIKKALIDINNKIVNIKTTCSCGGKC